MKLIFTLLFFSIFSFNVFGQIVFQKGYFINNQGKATECLIKNSDWKKNPKSFKYKFTEKGQELEGDLDHIQEFGVQGYFKFIKKEVEIDISSDNMQTLSTDKNPIWEKKVVFLRVLNSGEMDLFMFEGKDYLRFFYSLNDGEIKQLVFKRYLKGASSVLNLAYKQQLINELNPTKISQDKILNLSYTKEALEKFVDEYNGSFSTPTLNIQGKVKREIIEIKLTPGLSVPYFTIYAGNKRNKYDTNLEYRLGFEIDAVLPFNMNKWSIYVEPTFFMSNKTKKPIDGIDFYDIKIKLLSFPVGLKGKSFLKSNNTVFYDFNYDFGIGTGFNSTYANYLKIQPGSNFALGVGYEKKKFSLECRFLSTTNIIRKPQFRYTEYQRVQLILGYRLFKK